MKNGLFIGLVFCFSFCVNAQITLTHNIGDVPIYTGMPNCEYDESWGRVFRLSDFGIENSEQFIIRSGKVALSNAYEGARIGFVVSRIDDDFPSTDPIGLGGGVITTPEIGDTPEVLEIQFNTPVVVPVEVERVLITVFQYEDIYNSDFKKVLIAGTDHDNNESWFRGCREYYDFITTDNLKNPVPNANFFICVTGEIFSIQNSIGNGVFLSHNICGDVIETNIHSCSSAYIYWARAFNLSDFGVSTNEEFIISSGQVGINKTGWLPEISFNIYKIDDNFPDSFSETDLIGSSQYQQLSPNIDRDSQIIQVDFVTPVLVPSGVEKILVEVHKGIVYGDGVAFIAGSAQDNDVSWQRGCHNVSGKDYNEYVSTAEFGRPDANFFINITGNVNHVTNNFKMNISNICSEFLKEFSVEKKENIASVIWDFGDSASGIDNSSTDVSPFHDFSQDGTYTITATVTVNNGNVEVLTETIDVTEPPQAYGISDIYACEDDYGTGISSSFNTSNILQQVLGGQTNKIVVFIDGSGDEYNVLPNPFTNTVEDRETITVRVSHENNPCCYSEITFDLIVNSKPNLESVEDLIVCENNTSGYAFFDLETVKETIINNASDLEVSFYYENGNEIQEPLSRVENVIVNEEEITVKLIDTDVNCYNEATFKLKVNPLPIANPVSELIGCDDNNNGISEYFDTSNVEVEVLGNQTGMEITYFDSNGNLLPNPLPNPYINTIKNQEQITVRVTNPSTTCYAETELILKTSTKPQINKPKDIYSCNLDNGFAEFDTSKIQDEIIGNQNGLIIIFLDSSGNQIQNLISTSFTNSEAWKQTINIRVENELNSLCYSETSFNLIVNELPFVNIEDSYFLCDLEPFYNLIIDDSFDSYLWEYQDGSEISNTHTINLENAGNYSLTIGENKNGIYCENSFDFQLIRSELPTITDIEIKELSDENYIEVFVSGDGDFEYSIDDVNYQVDNIFNNILGGIYNVTVRDKLGCGEDSKEVILIDYPKYFTPNNDGVNDFWQIKGVKAYSNAVIHIYDRYGKLLKQISANSNGWDGTFNGKKLAPNDYWFTVKLDEYSFNGHFSLKL